MSHTACKSDTNLNETDIKSLNKGGIDMTLPPDLDSKHKIQIGDDIYFILFECSCLHAKLYWESLFIYFICEVKCNVWVVVNLGIQEPLTLC